MHEQAELRRRPSLIRRLSNSFLSRTRTGSFRASSAAAGFRVGGSRSPDNADAADEFRAANEEDVAAAPVHTRLLAYGAAARLLDYTLAKDSAATANAAVVSVAPADMDDVVLANDVAIGTSQAAGTLLTAGTNEWGTVDSRSHVTLVPRLHRADFDALAEKRIVSVAVGAQHSAVVTKEGVVMAFGANEAGQCGNPPTRRAVPRLMAGLIRRERVVQVAVGDSFSAMLTERGVVWTAGTIEATAPGRGGAPDVAAPVEGTLHGAHVVRVVCGPSRVFCLTSTRRAYWFGRGHASPLSVVTTAPRLVRLRRGAKQLDSDRVACIASCASHSAIVTVDGDLLTCGAENEHGELGRPDQFIVVDENDRAVTVSHDDDQFVMVTSFAGAGHMADVACGARTTLAVTREGDAYVFGSWARSLLWAAAAAVAATEQTDDDVPPLWTPRHIPTPVVDWSSAAASASSSRGGEPSADAAANADEAALADADERRPPSLHEAHFLSPAVQPNGLGFTLLTVRSAADADAFVFKKTSRLGRTHRFDAKTLLRLASAAVETGSTSALRGAMLELAHASVLSGCFWGGAPPSRVDVRTLAKALASLEVAISRKKDNESWLAQRYLELIAELGSSAPNVSEPDQVRAYFLACILVMGSVLPSVEPCKALLVSALARLPDQALVTLSTWFAATSDVDTVARFALRPVLTVLEQAVLRQDWSSPIGARGAVRVLKSLHASTSSFVPFDRFYADLKWSDLTLYDEWVRFVRMRYHQKLASATTPGATTTSPALDSIFDTPFLVSAATKRDVAQFEAQNSQLEQALITYMRDQGSPFFEIDVRRDALVSDAVARLLRARRQDFSKPLKVRFTGEPALDMGGVRKEFIALLTAELFDPAKSDVFCVPDGTDALWLNAEGDTAQRVKRAYLKREELARQGIVDARAREEEDEDATHQRNLEQSGGHPGSAFAFRNAPLFGSALAGGVFRRGGGDAGGGAGGWDSCPGHGPGGLLPFETYHGNFTCDVCGSGIPQGARAFGCRQCNWDACEDCRAAGEAARAAAAAAAPPPPPEAVEEEQDEEARKRLVLIGVLIGVAVYNSLLLDVRFSKLLIRALLQGVLRAPVRAPPSHAPGDDGDAAAAAAATANTAARALARLHARTENVLPHPTLSDLAEINPELARGLKAMLEYDADDFDDVFGSESFAVRGVHDLLGDGKGAHTFVTKSNRADYVHKRVAFEVRESVLPLLDALVEGLRAVVHHNEALSLFRPEEFEMMLCGDPDLDFRSLRGNAKYEGGFTPTSKVVVWLWEILVDEFTPAQKQAFLAFTTGSGRAPVGGLSRVHLLVQRAGPDSAQLPSAHTCFDTFLLPEYASKDKLREKLVKAVENAQGFGLQ